MRPLAHISGPAPICNTRRKYCTWWKPDHPVFVDVAVHANCQCNEITALRNRVLQAVPPTTRNGLDLCKPIAAAISKVLGRRTPLEGEWIQQYSGAKRTKYERAKQFVDIHGIHRKHAYLQSFIKPEKLQAGHIHGDAETKDPRLIQSRSAHYNYEVGNYLKAIEHDLYNIKGKGPLKPHFPGGRLIAKGLCQRRRAQLLRSKMEEFREPVVISLDCSRFDAHVTPEMLNLEHRVYLKCFGNDPKLRKLLSWQMHNVGFTAGGYRYYAKGGRSSGDMNTALGNCLLMLIMLSASMREMGFRTNQWQVLDDGDDCLLIVERSDEYKLSAISNLFREFGHELKLENRADEMAKVVFCQGAPLRTAGGGVRFVRNPQKVLNCTLVGVKHFQDPKCLPKLFRALGDGELALSSGVPVLQEFACMLLRAAGNARPLRGYDPYWERRARRELAYLRAKGPVCEPVAVETRVDFEVAFGIDYVNQLALEDWLRGITPGELLVSRP